MSNKLKDLTNEDIIEDLHFVLYLLELERLEGDRLDDIEKALDDVVTKLNKMKDVPRSHFAIFNL